jgi:hypothetical protein
VLIISVQKHSSSHYDVTICCPRSNTVREPAHKVLFDETLCFAWWRTWARGVEEDDMEDRTSESRDAATEGGVDSEEHVEGPLLCCGAVAAGFPRSSGMEGCE